MTSPNNTIVITGSPSAITDNHGNLWTISPSAQVLENGKVPAYSGNVALIAYANSIVWHENTSKQWYQWGGTGWFAGADPLPATPPPPPTPSKVLVPFDHSYVLVFDDEFDGTTLNLANWSTGWLASGITKGANGDEQEAMSPAQVSVNGGYLNLNAIAEQNTANNGKTYAYTSGMVNSYGKFTVVPSCYVEAKMTLPISGGKIANWPAFWLDGAGLNWPTDGEGDVMEGLNGFAEAHYHSDNGGPGVSPPSQIYNDGKPHIYAMWWTPTKASFYYDNKFIGSISPVTTAPMFLILDYAISSVDGGPTLVPATMKVDWVHVYQQAAKAITPQSGYTGPGGGAAP